MANPILDSSDVVVVGAGIAGITTAYELRLRGYDVVVVEQRFPAYGSSGRSAGSLWLQSCAAGPELELARAGKERYRNYVEDIGNTFGYRENGGLFFIESETQHESLEAYVRDRANVGLNMELLGADEAREAYPLLPSTTVAAAYCAEDAQVDTARFVKALTDVAKRRGVRVYENTSVLSAVRSGDAVVGVRTTRGDVRTAGLVWATGAWCVNLSTEGLDLPISTARQGQILTQALTPIEAPLMRGPRGAKWANALAALPGFSSSFPESDAGAFGVDFDDTLSQAGEGGLFIGSSIDVPGALNPHIGIAATHTMLAAALERYPEHAELGVVGLWAGLASWTDDQLPIIDAVDGVYVNVGHAQGVATGPIGGEIMASRVSGEEHRFASAVGLARFETR